MAKMIVIVIIEEDEVHELREFLIHSRTGYVETTIPDIQGAQ